jgi:hypothetical protein
MTSDKHFYLIDTSYNETKRVASDLFTLEAPRAVGLDALLHSTFASLLQCPGGNSIWQVVASTFRWRRTNNMMSVPRRYPWAHRPGQSADAPTRKSFRAASPRRRVLGHLNAALRGRLSLSILSGRKTQSIGTSEKIRNMGIADSTRQNRATKPGEPASARGSIEPILFAANEL